MDSTTIGKLLLIVGLLVAAAGGFMALGGKLPFGSLPGDISIRSSSTSFSFPIVSCIIISVVLTVVINLFLRR